MTSGQRSRGHHCRWSFSHRLKRRRANICLSSEKMRYRTFRRLRIQYPKTVSDCSETRPGTENATFDRLLRKDARQQDATQSREARSTTGTSTIDRGDSQCTAANRVSGTLRALPEDMLGHRRSCDFCSKRVMTLRTLYGQHRGSNTLQRRLRSICTGSALSGTHWTICVIVSGSDFGFIVSFFAPHEGS